MRVYLDNCCYNRPFDDQSQLKVRLEAEAKLEVQRQMRAGEVEYVWSEMLDSEALDSPFTDRKMRILRWRVDAVEYVDTDEDLLTRAEEIMEYDVKSSDAIHLASAERAGCDWFLTVDKGILNKGVDLGSVRIANPFDYVRETL